MLYLEQFKVSRSLKKSIRNKGYDVYLNRDFEAVISACAAMRADQEGTWITNDMQAAYEELHRLGLAHCVSVYKDGQLVGGLYGPSLGPFFFGESMFSTATDASKVALYYLIDYLKTKDFKLIDCQINNEHLGSLGAVEISRDQFLDLLEQYVHQPQPSMWQPRQLSEVTND